MSEEFRATLVGILGFVSGMTFSISLTYRLVVGNYGATGGYGALYFVSIVAFLAAVILSHVRHPENW